MGVFALPGLEYGEHLEGHCNRGQDGAVRPQRVAQMEDIAEVDFIRLITSVGVGRWLLL